MLLKIHLMQASLETAKKLFGTVIQAGDHLEIMVDGSLELTEEQREFVNGNKYELKMLRPTKK